MTLHVCLVHAPEICHIPSNAVYKGHKGPTVLGTSYFSFGGQVYQQTGKMVMALPLSPMTADL